LSEIPLQFPPEQIPPGQQPPSRRPTLSVPSDPAPPILRFWGSPLFYSALNQVRAAAKTSRQPHFILSYTGYALFFSSATDGSTLVCCASLYLKNSTATWGNRA